MMMRRLRVAQRRSEEKYLPEGFSLLADEIIQEILQYLRWPTDFYMLSLVCRMLYRHATPKLYATLVIAYHRPTRINALLDLLERDPGRAKCVSTLLFDEDVKSIGPNQQSRGKWQTSAFRRQLTDGWDPTSPELQSIKYYPNTGCHVKISRRLRIVLPTLSNLQRVVIRSLHPTYLYPEVEITNTSTEGVIWRCIVEGSPQLTELYVNGVPGGRLETVPLCSLTTVAISDLFWYVDGHADAARLWNAVLAGALNLKTLAMVYVEHTTTILEGLFFPGLQALELYMVHLCAPHEIDSGVFLDFLYRHSRTLHVLALSCPVWGAIDHSRWLSDKDILSELHTLRLNHAMALLITADELAVTELPECPSRTATLDEIQAQKTDILLEFIRHRPKILDVGILSLKRAEADKFARFLTATRPMRNVLIGGKVEQSLLSRTACSSRRYWGYQFDAWAFYELFGGLTITKSGFRPRLPPRSWEFWKKPTLR